MISQNINTRMKRGFHKDERLKPSHIAVYYALYEAYATHDCENPFPINQEGLRETSGIKSLKLYFECFMDLLVWGYIDCNNRYMAISATEASLLTSCTLDAYSPCNDDELYTQTKPGL